MQPRTLSHFTASSRMIERPLQTTETPSWFVNQLRLTAIGGIGLPSARDAWHGIFGTARSDDFSTRELKDVEECASSFADGRWAQVVRRHQDSNRLDLIQTAIPLGSYFGDYRSLRPLATVIERFVSPWISALSSGALGTPSRLALAGQLLVACEEHTHAFELLGRMLPQMEVDSDSNDFVFGINRPLPWNGIRINRLAKWSSRVALLVRSTLTGPPVTHVERHEVALDFDFNSDASVDLSSRKTLHADLVRLLHSEVIATASRGDHK